MQGQATGNMLVKAVSAWQAMQLTQRCDQLTDRPPDGEKGQEISTRRWQEFEEQCAINGQVAADTQTDASEKSAGANPARCSASGHTEDRGDKQGAVESQATSNNIGHDAPERGTNTQTEEEGESGVPDLLFSVAELIGERGKGKSNTLEPEVISQPAETAQGEQAPLVFAHADIGKCLVDDLALA